MKIPTFKVLFLAIIGIVIAVYSCTDDYSEKDFLADQERLMDKAHANDIALLQEQMQLAYQNSADLMELQDQINRAMRDENIEMLQTVGAVVTLDIVVVDLNDDPVSGVTVTIGNQAGEEAGSGEGGRVATAETGSDGLAHFNDVVIGGNSIMMEKEGYITATGAIYIAPGFETLEANGWELPVPRTEAAKFPLLSGETSGNNATITGKVIGEVNLLNDAPEVLEGIKIAADLKDFLDLDDGFGKISVIAYSLSGDDGFGTATTDAEGKYSLKVPAKASGDWIKLILPTINAKQILVINEKDGEDVAPMVDTVATAWGPLLDYSDIPDVAGVKAVFPAPDLAESKGEGFKMNFSVLPSRLAVDNTRDLEINGIDYSYPANRCVNDTLSAEWQIKVNSLGSGYSTSPNIAVTGGGGNGAEMYASLRTKFTAATVTNQGEGYDADAVGDADIYFRSVGLDGQDTLSFYVNDFGFTTTSDGKVPGTLDLPTSGVGFNSFINTDVYTTWYGYRVIGWVVVLNIPGAPTTEAAVTISTSGSVNRLYMYEGGRGYTDAADLVFSGGGSYATQADIDMQFIKSFYSIELDNSGVTSPYSYAPIIETVQYYGDMGGKKDEVNSVNGYLHYGKEIFNCDDKFENSDSINNALTVNSEGHVVWKDPAKVYISYHRSSLPPTARINEGVQPIQAIAYATVNSDGQVTGLDIPWGGNNPLTSYNANYGLGYTSPFGVEIMPTVEGLPGSGAVIDLTGQGVYWGNTILYQWFGSYFVANGGSEYLDEANRYDHQWFSGSTDLYIQSGDVIVNNIYYGTGQHLEDIGTND